MANLTMTNWRISDKLPYINLGSAGENNASMVVITVDALIENSHYYLDIGDESGSGLPNTQELTASTNIGTNGEDIYTLSMQPMVSWLGKEGVKLLQVRCVYEVNDKQVVKQSNVFHAKVDRNSGFVYKYDIAIFEEYLEKIRQESSTQYVTEEELINSLRPYATTTEMNVAIDNAVDDKQDILQYTILPTASEEELGHIYQYTGETIHSENTDLVHGYFYECVDLGTVLSPYYTWQNLNVVDFPISIYQGTSTGSVKINSSNNVSSGNQSTAEGDSTTASGNQSHAEGHATIASGYYSHAEGYRTQATNSSSHAQNLCTIAQGTAQTAIGKYNVAQGSTTIQNTDYAFIIGNGEANNRSNALAVQWDGTVVFQDGSKQKSSPYAIMGQLGAKNLLVYPYLDGESQTINGVEFSVDNNGIIRTSGTATGYAKFDITNSFVLKTGQYIISDACDAKTTQYIVVWYRHDGITDTKATIRSGTSTTFTISSTEEEAMKNGNGYLTIRLASDNVGAVWDNLIFYPMIRYSEDTDDSWQPYAPTNYDLNEKIEDIKENLNTSPIVGITCWGDSLTAMGGWTQKLQELSGISVYNGGTGGENSKCIMARQGGDVMIVDGITIPATTTAVTIASRATDIGISTELGNKVTPLFQSSAHVNPVTIGDVKGTLAWTGSSGTDQNGTWTFTRATVGEEIVIDRPTAIKTNFDTIHNGKNELIIIYMGANGGWSDNADLIHQHKLMIDHFKGKEYIILGLSTGSADSRASYESDMKEAFGRRFISLREYLAHPIYNGNGDIISCYGLADQNLEPSTKEYNGVTYVALDEIAQGIVPHQLLIDGIHYTTGTREVIGKMLYKKLVELNIL